MRAAIRLLTRLERRVEQAPQDERLAIEREIDVLTEATLHWAGHGEPEPGVSGSPPAGSLSWAVRSRLIMGTFIVLCLGAIALAGARLTGDPGPPLARVDASLARLIIESRPEDAQLRIRDPASEELLYKIPGAGVEIELQAGDYDVEVSREDCPDRWIRSIVLEAGETRRYEPVICEGAGELVVRSNVADDRLRIDEFDVGPTRNEPHLLGVGDHLIRVEKEGFSPFEGKVRIKPGQQQEVRAELVAQSEPSGESGGPGSLPFEVGVPSPPPQQVVPRGFESDFDDLQEALKPERVIPESIRPDPGVLSDSVLDLALASESGRMPKGGSTTWHDAVSRRVLKRFDANGSGAIDTVAETESIPCSFWRDVEHSFDKGGLGLSMGRLYGFDGSEWHEAALGFDRSQRVTAYERMQACGLAR
jgi:hypothetical protein